jgi:hypothetical protein
MIPPCVKRTEEVCVVAKLKEVDQDFLETLTPFHPEGE